jgi:hypothetical protein
MFVPCIIKRSRKNQHNAQICTTALFHVLALTCFGNSLPSSGSFWIRLSYVKNTDRYGGLSKICNRQESVCKAPCVEKQIE